MLNYELSGDGEKYVRLNSESVKMKDKERKQCMYRLRFDLNSNSLALNETAVYNG